MNDELLSLFPILHYFAFAHLPEKLQAVSKPFCELAVTVASNSNLGRRQATETSVALRKLLEAKDAAVRAAL